MVLTAKVFVLLAGSIAFATSVNAQTAPARGAMPPWVDTTGESGVYPLGDAVGVYRAALDLIYVDGEKRPPIIVLHDTAELRGDGPCPVACKSVWLHKSKMDTTTILSFARQSPKRPRIRDFGYHIPIVLISYDTVERMTHDGIGFLATQPPAAAQNVMPLWVEFRRKYPKAWGMAQLTKVGFNDRRTEALVQIRHGCGEDCASTETLFLKRIDGKWTVVERIPNYASASLAKGSLRYRGPAGTTPSESELLVAQSGRPSGRSESMEEAPVVRAVLDSLYSFQGEAPKMVVLTDRVRLPQQRLPPHVSRLDSSMIAKYAFLRGVRASPDPAFRYRLPIGVFLADSMPRLEERGIPLARKLQIAAPFWVAFREKFQNAWGMVGFSRVAFNAAHTQALVYSDHQCGDSCNHGDTWVLERTNDRWRVIERLPNEKNDDWELEPLRYVGLDAKPNSYRHRHVSGVFTNAVTKRPLSALRVNTRDNRGKSRVLTSDAAGRIALGRMPFAGVISMTVGCPDQSRPDSIFALDFVISPGVDTAFNAQLDFRQCLRPPPGEHLARTLSGAQAFVSETEARFVFPRRGPIYEWDVPLKGLHPGSPEYMWEVD